MRHGDLVIMGGTLQTTHKHAVPPGSKRGGARLNVTVRAMH